MKPRAHLSYIAEPKPLAGQPALGTDLLGIVQHNSKQHSDAGASPGIWDVEKLSTLSKALGSRTDSELRRNDWDHDHAAVLGAAVQT